MFAIVTDSTSSTPTDELEGQGVQDFIAQHGECEVRVIHADAADRVVELEDALEAAGIACNREKSGWIGAVIGTHAGPAAVAAVCCPKKYLI